MNNAVATTEGAKPVSVMTVLRNDLELMSDQFKAALPEHIPPDRFKRVVMTALQNNPALLNCSRKSLWNAAMRAAQDGLLADNREGAIVPYGTEAQWLPMIGGLRKKARNSGEIATWDVEAVYENDVFDYALGDNPFITHKPTLGDRGRIIAVYSIATLKSGEKSRSVMSIADVEKIRTKSRGKNTPWNDPVFYPEMAKKTVARRHAKTLPSSTDLDDLLRRDDELYDFKEARAEAKETEKRAVATGGNVLDSFAAEPETVDPDTGEIGADTVASSGETTPSDEDNRIANIRFEARKAHDAGRPKFPPSDMTDAADQKIYKDEWEAAAAEAKVPAQ